MNVTLREIADRLREMNNIAVLSHRSPDSDTLGCAAGNFAGGQLLQYFDVRVMLMAGVVMAAAGTAVLFLTVDKNDAEPAQVCS